MTKSSIEDIYKYEGYPQKAAIILESLGRGAINTSLEANGFTSICKFLKSGPKNWSSIISILNNDSNRDYLILGKLTEYVLFLCNHPNYTSVAKDLFDQIRIRKHILFIYNENLFGNFSFKNEVFEKAIIEDLIGSDAPHLTGYSKGIRPIDKWIAGHGLNVSPEECEAQIKAFISDLQQRQFNIVPYRKLLDLEIAGQEFINNSEQGLILRIYVPNEKLWSNEIDKMIVLFKGYVAAVLGLNAVLKQNRTDNGITFSIYSREDNLNKENIGAIFDQFTQFLDICSDDPEKAAGILSSSKLPPSKIASLISKYSKETKRILLDIKHEREAKFLSIKHRLESEIMEENSECQDLTIPIPALPEANKPSNLFYERSLTLSSRNLTVNLNPQIIHKIEGIVAQEIHGQISFNANDEQLIRLIEENSINKAQLAELKSSLHELKDKSVSKEERTTAWQRLQSFLSKIGDKVGDVGLHLLKKYLEQLLFQS